VADDCSVQPFDDVRQHRKPARGAGIGPIPCKNIADGALGPVGRRGVDNFLHVAPVEVYLRAIRQVRYGTWETQHVPENGAGGGDLVDVEAGVYFEDGGEDRTP